MARSARHAVPGGLARPAWALAGVIGRPFAGIPLALKDGVYRPLFVFFLLLGTAAGLWLNFVAVWLSQDLGATPAQVGWFFGLGFLAAAAGNSIMPAVAERAGSRKVVALWLMASGVPAIVAVAFANGYWMALLSFTVLWFGSALVALLLGLAGDVARERALAGGRDQTGTVIAALQTAMALGGALAPLFGGWLYEQTGQLRPAVLLHLVPGLAANWVLWRYVPDHGRTAPAARAAPPRSAGAIGLALALLLAAMVWFRLGDARGPFEMVYAAQELGASKAQVGVLITTLAALQLVLTPVMGALSDRAGAGPVTAMGIAILAAHGFALAGTSAYWQQLALVVLVAGGLAIGSTAPFVYAQQLAPGRAAAATGWLSACFFLGLAGGSPLAGRVVELAGFRGLFVFSGAMDLVAAAMVGALVLGRTPSFALHHHAGAALVRLRLRR